MPYADPEGWVRRVEALYRANDAEGVSALYTDDCTTRMGSRVLTPEEVHAHPREWFDALDDYVISRHFRASYGDVIVSETVAHYTLKSEGKRYSEFGTDVYWVNDDGLIYHKHTCEIVEPYGLRPLTDHDH